jgi:hypothetical protein
LLVHAAIVIDEVFLLANFKPGRFSYYEEKEI